MGGPRRECRRAWRCTLCGHLVISRHEPERWHPADGPIAQDPHVPCRGAFEDVEQALADARAEVERLRAEQPRPLLAYPSTNAQLVRLLLDRSCLEDEGREGVRVFRSPGGRTLTVTGIGQHRTSASEVQAAMEALGMSTSDFCDPQPLVAPLDAEPNRPIYAGLFTRTTAILEVLENAGHAMSTTQIADAITPRLGSGRQCTTRQVAATCSRLLEQGRVLRTGVATYAIAPEG